MLYLSKGFVAEKRENNILYVAHCGVKHVLTGIGVQLWSDGQYGLGEADGEREIRHLRELQRLGLVETSEETGPLAVYRLLAKCIICQAEPKPMRAPLSPPENRLWQWIDKAGLRLSIGELTKLVSGGVSPSPELLGTENVQELTMLIYADNLAADTTPDILMESSPERDTVVKAVLGLLRKKRLVLI